MLKKKPGRKLIGFLVVMGAIFGLCSGAMLYAEKGGSESGNSFSAEELVSHESGFYQQDIQVEIAVPKGAQAYYTFNCESPDRENGQLYEEPVTLCAEDPEQVYVLRFKVFYDDGGESEVVTRTYFMGTNIKQRYDMFVMNITGEPEDLFGYENGIFVPGIRYDEFRRQHPDVHPGGGEVEANYNMRGEEFEREVYIEMFRADGERILAQNGGVRIHGALSRLNNQKSFRLYARKEYDEENKFNFIFFDDLRSEEGVLGREYKRLIIRNSGQDYGYAFLRSELIGRLAAQAGFPDTQYVTPVCVYMNGMYYGNYWLTSNYDAQYFENRYGKYEGEFVILEGGDSEKVATGEEDQQAVDEFNACYADFASKDLTVDENYQELQNFLDVENYLQYFAIENYVGNDDWPTQNLKTYRYIAKDDEYQKGTVFDGRWRMLLFDTDYGFGLLYYYETIGCLVNKMTLDKIMSDNTPLFRALMERQDCREYFISYTLDLINGAMNVNNVTRQVDEMHQSHVQELQRTLDTEGLAGGLLLEDEWLNMETVERNVQQIKDYALARPQYVLQDIREKFSYEQLYELNVVVDNPASFVKVNSVYCENDVFKGIYFKEIPVVLSPCLGPNEIFDHWLVDGEVRSEEQLTLHEADIMGDVLEIHLVTHEAEEPRLQINAVAAKGQADFVELINFSTQPVSTGGYYLSDNEDPYRYELPVMLLNPGETVRVVGESNSSVESLGEFAMNFNLKEGELLTLTYRDTVIDSVAVPDMAEEGVYVRDFQKGTYIEKKREQVIQ